MAWIRASAGGGGGGGGDSYVFSSTQKIRFSSRVGLLTDLTPGKSYMLIIAFGWSNSNYSAKLASASNTTNLAEVNSGTDAVGTTYCNTDWSIYTFTATGTSSTLTFSSMSSADSDVRIFLFEKA